MKSVNKKISPKYFTDVQNGAKTFELRKDEDDIQVGDVLILEEWSDTTGYTGKMVKKKVLYVLRDVPEYGLKDGYCIIGFGEVTMQMTEKEAIKWQTAFRKTYNGFPKEVNEACDMAIQALKEIQQYRAIGTVEECREAVEKQTPMKPIKSKGECFAKSKDGTEGYEIVYSCPSCGSNNLMRGYPCKCGQMIDWEE